MEEYVAPYSFIFKARRENDKFYTLDGKLEIDTESYARFSSGDFSEFSEEELAYIAGALSTYYKFTN